MNMRSPLPAKIMAPKAEKPIRLYMVPSRAESFSSDRPSKAKRMVAGPRMMTAHKLSASTRKVVEKAVVSVPSISTATPVAVSMPTTKAHSAARGNRAISRHNTITVVDKTISCGEIFSKSVAIVITVRRN